MEKALCDSDGLFVTTRWEIVQRVCIVVSLCALQVVKENKILILNTPFYSTVMEHARAPAGEPELRAPSHQAPPKMEGCCERDH